MLRWISGDQRMASRTLTEEQFIGEVLRLAENSFAAVSGEPILVEGVDTHESVVHWRAYLEHPRELLGLARQLAVERSLRHHLAADRAASDLGPQEAPPASTERGP